GAFGAGYCHADTAAGAQFGFRARDKLGQQLQEAVIALGRLNPAAQRDPAIRGQRDDLGLGAAQVYAQTKRSGRHQMPPRTWRARCRSFGLTPSVSQKRSKSASWASR